MPARRLFLPAALACALLAGCGGATPRTPGYVAAGNAICGEQGAQLAGMRRPATVGEAVAYLPSVLSVLRTETSRLDGLHVSGAGHARLTAALASTRALTALLAGLLRQLRHGMIEFGQLAAVQTQTTALREQVDARFRQADLPRCAE